MNLFYYSSEFYEIEPRIFLQRENWFPQPLLNSFSNLNL